MTTKIKFDLTGLSFGDWQVLEKANPKFGNTMWKCRCACGTIRLIPSGNLRKGKTLGCGCRRSERVSAGKTKHGHSAGGKTPIYHIWSTIKQRCGKWPAYKDVQFHKIWNDSFEQFLKDVGEPPTPKHSLDRIDGKSNYEPGNVRWATSKEQGRNKSNTIKLTYRGVEKPLQEWAEILEIPAVTLHARIKRYGMSIEQAFNTPIRMQKNNAIPTGAPHGPYANDRRSETNAIQEGDGRHDG